MSRLFETVCEMPRQFRPRVLIACCIGFGLSTHCADSAQNSAGSLQRQQTQHQKRQQRFVAELESIAKFCDANQQQADAENIRTLATASDAGAFRKSPLPVNVQPEIRSDLPPVEREWRIRLRKTQKDYAKDVYLSSRRALKAGHFSFAYQLLHEVAVHDSDHRSARRLLGFQRYGDQWMTPFAANMQRRRQQWHDKFGWLPTTHIDKYKNGQRFLRNKWVSAEKEAEYRRDFRHAWQIRTEHYEIKTNVSLEEGVELGKALEEFHQFFHQTFVAFFSTPEQIQKLFEGPTRSTRRTSQTKPFVVHYYRKPDEYFVRLRRKYPQIEMTNGLYDNDDRVVYFFKNPELDAKATLFHEATHQLFSESNRRNWSVAETGNFWIVEGIACYIESYKPERSRFVLGDPRYIRFQAARHRFFTNKYYVPLADFAGMGMREFQSQPQPTIRMNYSQSAGLAHFFMHYEGGSYRDALIEHISQIYNANPNKRERVQSLAELTGTSFKDLDRQYAEFLKLQEDLLNGSGETNN